VDKKLLTVLFRQKAQALGFEAVGFAKAEFLEEDAPKLENWLNQNRHGQMAYMANHFDIRLDPRKLVDGAKTVVSLLMNYYPENELEGNLKIAKYAYGKDYHKVIKKKLVFLINDLKNEIGDFNARAFVDSAPIMERSWAVKSGLGWMGKNTLLLGKHRGSFHFLAEIVTDLEFEYDVPVTDHCGTCTACIDACPTDAITEPYQLDASKCISYFTIELKDNLPEEFKGKFQNWVFGCDICQDVCPWNSKSKSHSIIDFLPNEDLKNVSKNDFQEITLETFDKVFTGSAVKRTKYEGFVRNILFEK
jgi:epoxyqueuosine reductase